MSSLLFSAIVLGCVSDALGAGYAPVPAVEPSPLAYGSPYSAQQQVDASGYPRQQHTVDNTIYVQPQVEEVPIEFKTPSPEPKSYEYPIQVPAAQNTYEYQYPSTVYNDQYDTTTTPTTTTTTTTTTTAPYTEDSEDEENYGVPEIVQTFSPNPIPQEASINSQPVKPYAPAPLVEAAPSAYGAPVASSYDSTAQYNDLEYNAGEVPSEVVVPGNPESALNEFFPTRGVHLKKKIVRAQKRLQKSA